MLLEDGALLSCKVAAGTSRVKSGKPVLHVDADTVIREEGEGGFGFSVVTATRSLMLVAPSNEERQEWISSLKSVKAAITDATAGTVVAAGGGSAGGDTRSRRQSHDGMSASQLQSMYRSGAPGPSATSDSKSGGDAVLAEGPPVSARSRTQTAVARRPHAACVRVCVCVSDQPVVLLDAVHGDLGRRDGRAGVVAGRGAEPDRAGAALGA